MTALKGPCSATPTLMFLRMLHYSAMTVGLFQ